MKIDGTPEELAQVLDGLSRRNDALVDAMQHSRKQGDEPGVRMAREARSATFSAMEAVETAMRQQATAGARGSAALTWVGDGVALEPDVAGAKARAFASFNEGPHLCVNVPNGNYTISARTASGKRVTFSFVPYDAHGEGQCVDVQYHDSGRTQSNGQRELPSFSVVGFRPGPGDSFDTRNPDKGVRGEPTLITVLMDEAYQASKGAAA